MKLLVTNIVALAVLSSLMSFKPDPDSKPFAFKISKESFIIIHGKTNINTFECNYFDFDFEREYSIDLIQKNGFYCCEGAVMSVNTCYFDCGNKMMNSDVRKLLKSNEFPHLEIL